MKIDEHQLRFSNSNAIDKWGFSIEVTQEGAVTINGQHCGFITLIYTPDKNRLQGYVAYVQPDKPADRVEIFEMDAIIELLKLRHAQKQTA